MASCEKSPADSPLFDSVTETFELRPPVYEFGFSQSLQPDDAQRDECDRPKTGGKNDRLDDITEMPFADGAAQTVICRGALEHVFEPRRAMAEMYRILRPGGVIFVCVPGNRSRDDGNHLWHFTPQAVQQLLQPFAATIVGWQGADQQPHTIFAVACKTPVDAPFLRGMNLFPEHCQRRLHRAAGQIGFVQKLKQAMVAWAFNPQERRRFADHYRVQFAIHMPVENLSKQQLLASCLGEIKSGSRLDL